MTMHKTDRKTIVKAIAVNLLLDNSIRAGGLGVYNVTPDDKIQAMFKKARYINTPKTTKECIASYNDATGDSKEIADSIVLEACGEAVRMENNLDKVEALIQGQ